VVDERITGHGLAAIVPDVSDAFGRIGVDAGTSRHDLAGAIFAIGGPTLPASGAPEARVCMANRDGRRLPSHGAS
jgi:hypothetical protein